MLLSVSVELTWYYNNKKWLESKKYIFTNYKDKVVVLVGDLPPTSTTIVEVQCDYCFKKFSRPYGKFLKSKETIKKDSCYGCKSLKTLETNMLRYGKLMASQLESVKEKTKEDNNKKFGKDWYTQTDKYKEDNKKHSLEKYNCENPSQAAEVKEKTRKTVQERYGADSVFKNKEIKEKIKNTNLRKFGFENALSNKDIRKKARETMFLRGNAPSSKPQRYLSDLLGGALNYPMGKYSLDIAFPDENIYLEYDGSGHDLSVRMGQITKKEFLISEIIRRKFMKLNNWKLIKIISSHDLFPSDEKIQQLVLETKNFLILGERSWQEIDFDLSVIRNKNGSYPINLGNLNKVSGGQIE